MFANRKYELSYPQKSENVWPYDSQSSCENVTHPVAHPISLL